MTDPNAARYRPGQTAGHYESFFVRANHPTQPLAFWIRYTVFSPAGAPESAIGELWAIFFDGSSGVHVAVKREVPIARCAFAPDRLSVEVDGARFDSGTVRGEAASGGHGIAWDLSFRGGEDALYLLPERLYAARLPRAKSLVPKPLAVFAGSLTVDGASIGVEDWVGSQNHNWGERHTDRYAWAQVAGFDDAPGAFLEVASAKLKIGPLWTPFLTLLVLRHEGREVALNSIRQALGARVSLRDFEWTFRSAGPELAVEGRITAPRASFVGLRYRNPPGGVKHCLNSKIASCELVLTGRGAAPRTIRTRHRAAFEILTDDSNHGVEIRA